MTDIDRSAPVAVTGATGYVAGWLVKRLLDDGLTVHAPIRSPDNRDKRRHLDDMAANAPGEIRYFEADLLEAGSYDAAFENCELVFHTASPFSTGVDDPKRQLIEPALEGTRNVLASVERTDSVKRVVLTSSVAAVYGDNIDCEQAPNKTLDESHWNTTSSPEHNPYQYSKTVAEREAWEIAGQQSRWDLVVVNPGLVLGPGQNPEATSESFKIVRDMGNRKMWPGVPLLGLATVDVRDVAEAHYLAGFTPAAEGRHIIAGENTTLMGMADALRADYGNAYPLPKFTIPAIALRPIAPMLGYSQEFAKRNFGYRLRVDNSKSRKALGISYRPLSETMPEFFDQLIEHGMIK